jgi:LysM repeat protein
MEPKENVAAYIVEKGDTIDSIALKFNITIDWIKEKNGLSSNHIFPGQKLVVKSNSELETTYSVENVTIYKTKVAGKLLVKNACLSFIPLKDKKQARNIDLRGYLESSVIPHPNTSSTGYVEDPLSPDFPCLFIITWFDNVDKMSTLETMFFEGEITEMDEMSRIVVLQAQEIQKTLDIIIKMPEPVAREHLSRVAVKPKPMSAPMKCPVQPVNRRSRRMAPPKFIGQSRIFKEEDIEAIRRILPYQYKEATWKLLFQLSQDGSSYITFYEKCKNLAPVLLIIKTDQEDRIGAYVSNGFKISKNFYGSGETFVFTCEPKFEAYRWQNSNQYFISSSKEDISVGGGGASAIWIDHEFLNAFSEPCPTFNSPSLSKQPRFSILDVEVWQLSLLL